MGGWLSGNISGRNARPEAWCPLLFCSSGPPVSLSGLPGWTAESIRRGQGGERIQRAQKSVSRLGRTWERAARMQASQAECGGSL